MNAIPAPAFYVDGFFDDCVRDEKRCGIYANPIVNNNPNVSICAQALRCLYDRCPGRIGGWLRPCMSAPNRAAKIRRLGRGKTGSIAPLSGQTRKREVVSQTNPKTTNVFIPQSVDLLSQFRPRFVSGCPQDDIAGRSTFSRCLIGRPCRQNSRYDCMFGFQASTAAPVPPQQPERASMPRFLD